LKKFYLPIDATILPQIKKKKEGDKWRTKWGGRIILQEIMIRLSNIYRTMQ
jgi:hypothetical protein